MFWRNTTSQLTTARTPRSDVCEDLQQTLQESSKDHPETPKAPQRKRQGWITGEHPLHVTREYQDMLTHEMAVLQHQQCCNVLQRLHDLDLKKIANIEYLCQEVRCCETHVQEGPIKEPLDETQKPKTQKQKTKKGGSPLDLPRKGHVGIKRTDQVTHVSTQVSPG